MCICRYIYNYCVCLYIRVSVCMYAYVQCVLVYIHVLLYMNFSGIHLVFVRVSLTEKLSI